MTVATDFWASVLSAASEHDRKRVHAIATHAETLRDRADYNTGSILEDEALALMMLADHISARVVIEVGTFIGLSTTAMSYASSVERVYTCDCSNDCLDSTDRIWTFPKTSSNAMLVALKQFRVRADLCFFDGVLNKDDVRSLAELTRPETVYAFHDYNYGPKIRSGKNGSTYLETVPRKGIGNVSLLKPHLSTHALIEPREGTTLALLVPESMR